MKLYVSVSQYNWNCMITSDSKCQRHFVFYLLSLIYSICSVLNIYSKRRVFSWLCFTSLSCQMMQGSSPICSFSSLLKVCCLVFPCLHQYGLMQHNCLSPTLNIIFTYCISKQTPTPHSLEPAHSHNISVHLCKECFLLQTAL